ncbi:MAG: right-handed parallel beta-helix repeat-containing protein [Neisseria sp.]|uniref:right-handed parallel beta-helix repeat-containing protein n=1 Tax=Neisseria sp. TaxID=192066 RepID=UPI0026DD9551|nr:right-handed parallel beta-helix repeat-containing protein [Neisseria sp.]MDO4249134.1 right-handed parallel beta-helix repeat-containing protein [Neisseria sp.]
MNTKIKIKAAKHSRVRITEKEKVNKEKEQELISLFGKKANKKQKWVPLFDEKTNEEQEPVSLFGKKANKKQKSASLFDEKANEEQELFSLFGEKVGKKQKLASLFDEKGIKTATNFDFDPDAVAAQILEGLNLKEAGLLSRAAPAGRLTGNEYAANATDTASDAAGDSAAKIPSAGGGSVWPWLLGLGLGGGLIAGAASAGGGSDDKDDKQEAAAGAAAAQNTGSAGAAVASDNTQDAAAQGAAVIAGQNQSVAPATGADGQNASQTGGASADANGAFDTINQEPATSTTATTGADAAGSTKNTDTGSATTAGTTGSSSTGSSGSTATRSAKGSTSAGSASSEGKAEQTTERDDEPSASGGTQSTVVSDSGTGSGTAPAAGTQDENSNTLGETSTQQENDLTKATDTTITTDAFVSGNVPSGAAYAVVGNAADAAKAAAANSALTHIVISDGNYHTLFTKGTAGDYKTTWGSDSWGATFTDSVAVSAFHDGGSDITAALQTALNVAAKKGLGVEMPENGSYTLSGSCVTVLNGTDYLHGNGSTLTYENVTTPGFKRGITLDKNIANFEIEGFTFDLNNLEGVRGIFGSNSTNVSITGNNFVNVANRAINFVTESGNITGLQIGGNNIVMPAGKSSDAGSNYAIVIYNQAEASSDYSGSLTKWQEYRSGASVGANTYEISNVKITGNNITGGYYGIAFSGVSDSTISNNVISENVRNISMQNRSDNNTVSGNYLSEAQSSGVHIAYLSNGNTVTGNFISSSKATGQGLLQAYQGSQNNKFIDNEINVTSEIGTGWMLYTGTDASGTVFSKNTINGNVNRNVIAAESIWDSNASAGVIGAYMPHPISTYDVVTGSSYTTTYNGGTGDLNNVSISQNIFSTNTYKYTPTVSLLYMGAESSTGLYGSNNFVGDINNLKFVGNTVVGGSGFSNEELIETHTSGSAAVNNFTNAHNSILSGTVQNYIGSSANNAYYMDNTADTASEAANGGTDTVYATVDYTLQDNLENLVLLNISNINGTGNNQNNILQGNVADNVLSGGGGNDTLIGGEGKDTLTGGEGSDTFLFNSVLNGTTDVDTITDFTPGTDKIGLEDLVFGSLEGDWFAQANAVTADTRVYQSGTKLYFDADGSGKNFTAVQFAEITGLSTELTETNFAVY